MAGTHAGSAGLTKAYFVQHAHTVLHAECVTAGEDMLNASKSLPEHLPHAVDGHHSLSFRVLQTISFLHA